MENYFKFRISDDVLLVLLFLGLMLYILYIGTSESLKERFRKKKKK